MKNWDTIFLKGRDFTELNELFADRLLRHAEQLTKTKPSTVIDLGCGTGQALEVFARRGLSGLGIDGSKEAIMRARRRLKNAGFTDIVFEQNNLEQLKLEKQYDLVFSKLVIAFIKDRLRFLQTVRNLMHEHSVFILVTPVLHTEITYQKTDKPSIAVDFEKIRSELQDTFMKVEIFNHMYFGTRQDVVTFICKD